MNSNMQIQMISHKNECCYASFFSYKWIFNSFWKMNELLLRGTSFLNVLVYIFYQEAERFVICHVSCFPDPEAGELRSFYISPVLPKIEKFQIAQRFAQLGSSYCQLNSEDRIILERDKRLLCIPLRNALLPSECLFSFQSGPSEKCQCCSLVNS